MLAAALLALAAPTAAPAPPPVRARVVASARIVSAVEVREGRSAQPHQRRHGRSPEGRPVTLLEFE